ncbi:heterokaryon incompatibility protein-domain-containing protein, partial [Diaporthe sp. PMI_573]
IRLLDVRSVNEDRLSVFHELLENGPSSPLRYAILSHTWGKRQDNKDIAFDDIPSSETFARFLDEATQLKQWKMVIEKKKTGFSKITNACRLAREMNLDYIWIDSCCIDKSKSAELNESIDSMYRWYQSSEQCIVYLEDLEPRGGLRRCRWFKRGWTLQEPSCPPEPT